MRLALPPSASLLVALNLVFGPGAVLGSGAAASPSVGTPTERGLKPEPVPVQAELSPTRVIVDGRMEAEVVGDDVRVRLTWRISGPSGPLEVTALQWPSGQVVGVEVGVMGRAAGLRPSGPETEGTGLSERRWLVEAPPRDSLVLLYAVRAGAVSDGGRRRVRIPVLLPEVAAPPSLRDMFGVLVRLPAGLAVRGGFPSELAIEQNAEGSTVSASLPVLPRWIELDVVEGELGLTGRVGALEAVSLLLIVCAGTWGWRRMTVAG